MNRYWYDKYTSKTLYFAKNVVSENVDKSIQEYQRGASYWQSYEVDIYDGFILTNKLQYEYPQTYGHTLYEKSDTNKLIQYYGKDAVPLLPRYQIWVTAYLTLYPEYRPDTYIGKILANDGDYPYDGYNATDGYYYKRSSPACSPECMIDGAWHSANEYAMVGGVWVSQYMSPMINGVWVQ